MGITFNRLHDHGSSAHVSVADSDIPKLLALKTFLGRPIEITEAKPLVSTLQTDVTYAVLETGDEDFVSNLLDERGYTVKTRVVAPKSEATKSYKLVAVKTSTAVKTRALEAYKHLATDVWVEGLPPGSVVFAIRNLFAAGGVIEEFVGIVDDLAVTFRRTDRRSWVHICHKTVASSSEDEQAEGDADGGQTEDEAEEPPRPIKPVRRK
jgi:hypothetical protein